MCHGGRGSRSSLLLLPQEQSPEPLGLGPFLAPLGLGTSWWKRRGRRRGGGGPRRRRCCVQTAFAGTPPFLPGERNNTRDTHPLTPCARKGRGTGSLHRRRGRGNRVWPHAFALSRPATVACQRLCCSPRLLCRGRSRRCGCRGGCGCGWRGCGGRGELYVHVRGGCLSIVSHFPPLPGLSPEGWDRFLKQGLLFLVFGSFVRARFHGLFC